MNDFWKVVAMCDHLKTDDKNNLFRPKKLTEPFLFIRNKRVMPDADLAIIFGTTTKMVSGEWSVVNG